MKAFTRFLCAVGLGFLTGCGSRQQPKDMVTLLGLNPDGTTNLVAVSDMTELVKEFLACFPGWDKPVTNGVPSELPFPYLYRVEFELAHTNLEIPVYHQDPRIFLGLWRHPSGVHVYFEPEKSRKFMELVNILSPSANQTVERTGAPPASSEGQ
jgi:hypothetical protein